MVKDDIAEAAVNMTGTAEIGYFGDVYVRMHHHASVDDAPLIGHQHTKDHVTFVTAGRIRVEWERDGRSGAKVFAAPTWFIQDKNAHHTIYALEPGSTWWCVFAFGTGEAGSDPIVDNGNNPYV